MTSLPMETLGQIRDFISRHYGIHYQDVRLPDLAQKLGQVSRAQDWPAPGSLARRLLAGELSALQLQQLVETLTVGETYFFREAEAIDALFDRVLPDIKRRRGRRLRLWSAGCASGEEPYSLAMSLDARLADLASWDLSILATDLNGQALQKARRGRYGDWSFRGMPQHYKQRYFTPEADGSFLLAPRIRQLVHFEQLNLVQDEYPSPENGTHGIDVLFCRNVLMYFAPATINRIVERYARALAPGGWLVISQTECSHYFQHLFETVQCGRAFLFRKRESAAGRTTLASPGAGLPQAGPGIPPGSSPPLPPARHAPSSEALLQRARELADQGRLDEARQQCEVVLAQQKLSVEGHYLHAMILQELEHPEDAVAALRRVLYLQPDAIMAHIALGNLNQRQGKRREAQRHFDHAFRLVGAHAHDSEIPGAEGMSAGRLQDLLLRLRQEV